MKRCPNFQMGGTSLNPLKRVMGILIPSDERIDKLECRLNPLKRVMGILMFKMVKHKSVQSVMSQSPKAGHGYSNLRG